MLLFTSCSNQSLDDFREEGNGINHALIVELKQIRTRDDLLIHAANLQKLFNNLVDIIIRAQEYKLGHPQAAVTQPSKNEQSLGDQLRIELNRVLHLEGGREVIEKAQEEALNRLDAFETRKKMHS